MNELYIPENTSVMVCRFVLPFRILHFTFCYLDRHRHRHRHR